MIRPVLEHADDDNEDCSDAADDSTQFTVKHSMSSNRDMSGQVLNREAMELYSEKDTDDKQCLSQKYLQQATPYLLCFLSIMVCVLGGAIYQAHMETGLLEEEIVTLRQSMDKVESSRGEKGERGGSGLPGLPGMNGQKGRPGLAGFRGQDGIPGLDGESGQKGGAGDIGPEGTLGLKGEQGGKGDRGEFGKKGEVGSPGASGTRGLKGERGSIGPVGPMGETVFNGTDIEVEGPPGPKGEIGEQGEKGEKGDSVTIADPFGKIATATYPLIMC